MLDLKLKTRVNTINFNNFKANNTNRTAYKKAINFDSNDTGLYLYGPAGVGKTHLAYATLNKIRSQGQQYVWWSKFLSVPELLLRIRQSFNKISPESELDIIDSCTEEVIYLFLDDFGSEKISDWTAETLYIILNRFSIRIKPKIFITSNLSLKVVSEKMSDRIASRIVEMCEIAKLEGQDYRLEKKGG